MRTFHFDFLMSLPALFQKIGVPEFMDGAQNLDVIFSSLSLSGYAMPLEGTVIVFLFLIGVYVVFEHNTRLLPQEKCKLATTMVRRVHMPLVLLHNRLEEIVESGVSGDISQLLAPVLEYAGDVIMCHRNILKLDMMNWEVVSEGRTTEVEVHNYVRMVAVQCQSYADSHHVRMEINHNEGYAGCRINESFMTAALQHLLGRLVDITAPGGCINITVSHDTGFWKLQAGNSGKIQEKVYKRAIPIPVPCGFRTIGKIIRLHGGRMTAYKHGKSTLYRIVMPTDCVCRERIAVSPDILVHRQGEEKNGNIIGFSKKEGSAMAGELPHIWLVIADETFGNYLQTALSGEFAISLRGTLDMQKLVSAKEKPDAIVIDENVSGTCGDELCSRIKAEEVTAVIPVILLVDNDDSKSYRSHIGSGANRLELRTTSTCRLRTNIHMLISSCTLLRKQTNRMLADTVHILPQKVEKDDDSLFFISKVRKLIEKNLATQGYTINNLCADAGMSRTGFYNRMKEVTGQYPTEYVLTFKMEKAKMLLSSGLYSVTEVAEMVGYCDAKYFGKKFKAFFHACPTRFIKEG